MDLVVTLGGDGTVNEVVNGLLHDGPDEKVPALGVVPGGSTNVFARALGLPRDAVEGTGALLDALDRDRARLVGLGRADGRYFTFCAGFGLDAEVVRKVERLRLRGRVSTPGLYMRTPVHPVLPGDRTVRPDADPRAAGRRDRAGPGQRDHPEHRAVDLHRRPPGQPVPGRLVRDRAGPDGDAGPAHSGHDAGDGADPVAASAILTVGRCCDCTTCRSSPCGPPGRWRSRWMATTWEKSRR